MRERITINCPFCRRRMKRHDDEKEGRRWWCPHCEALFKVEQMTWVPKELIEKAETAGQAERLREADVWG